MSYGIKIFMKCGEDRGTNFVQQKTEEIQGRSLGPYLFDICTDGI
jgi:hypothetical protein